MSKPLSDVRLHEIAERCDWVLSDERQSMARELLAARERLRLADALAEAAIGRDRCPEECRVMRPHRGCTCGDAALRSAIDVYRGAARGAR